MFFAVRTARTLLFLCDLRALCGEQHGL